jgi:hypothetical protein
VPWPEDAPPFVIEGFDAEGLPDPHWSIYTQWFEVDFQADIELQGENVAAFQRGSSDLLGSVKRRDSWSETLAALYKDMKRREENRRP